MTFGWPLIEDVLLYCWRRVCQNLRLLCRAIHRPLSNFVSSNSIALLSESILKLYRTSGIFAATLGDLTKDTSGLRVGPVADTGSNVETRALG
jgi:hypothetical protein